MEKTTMATAQWNGTRLAKSDKTIVIEGNHYFPKDSVQMQYMQPSDMHTTCVWKGEASYYDIVVDGMTNPGAAWYYPSPMPGAIERVGKDFSGYIAFWRGVEIA
jgi:uncharacterized protein (DUF427 family)